MKFIAQGKGWGGLFQNSGTKETKSIPARSNWSAPQSLERRHENHIAHVTDNGGLDLANRSEYIGDVHRPIWSLAYDNCMTLKILSEVYDDNDNFLNAFYKELFSEELDENDDLARREYDPSTGRCTMLW